MSYYIYNAFYKGGPTQGFFRCVSGNEYADIEVITGKLKRIYAKAGHCNWFVIVLEIDIGQQVNIFLDSESKRFLPVLYLIYDHRFEISGKEISFTANPKRVNIGFPGKLPFVYRKEVVNPEFRT